MILGLIEDRGLGIKIEELELNVSSCEDMNKDVICETRLGLCDLRGEVISPNIF